MAENYKLPYSGADIYRRLRDVDTKAKVMTMTTDEFEALEDEKINANTLYILTDADEEEEVLITIEDIDNICSTTT